jgi:hypothetical protein
VAKLIEGGNGIFDNCLTELNSLLIDSGTGNVQANYGARYRLPKSLSSADTVKWDTRGQTGIKDSVGPLSTS